MLNFLTQFASADTESSGDLLGSLGIDWQVLILQMISFVLLVLFVAKFIYPQIAAMLDRREKIIKDSVKAAQEAEKKSAESEAETAQLLAKARSEAGDIVEAAKKESADIVAGAEADAVKKAGAIVAGAKADLDREVQAARKALRNEVVDLVAIATEKVVETKIDSRDEKIIADTIKENK